MKIWPTLLPLVRWTIILVEVRPTFRYTDATSARLKIAVEPGPEILISTSSNDSDPKGAEAYNPPPRTAPRNSALSLDAPR